MVKSINIKVKPVARYQYIEVDRDGTFVYFSDTSPSSFKPRLNAIKLDKSDLDNDCRLDYGKYYLDMNELFEVETT